MDCQVSVASALKRGVKSGLDEMVEWSGGAALWQGTKTTGR